MKTSPRVSFPSGRSIPLLAISVVTAALLLIAPAAQGFTTKKGSITTNTGYCSVRAGGGIGCFGKAVPAPNGTDGYLWLKASGKAHQAESGGAIGFPQGPTFHLNRGDIWQKRGVTCYVGGGIKCKNRKGHGFKMNNRKFVTF